MELLTIFILGVIILFVIGIVLFVVYSPAEAVPSPIPVVTVPDAPTGVSAVRGNARATISFTAPVNTGGSAITEYKINSSPATTEQTTSSAGSYTFTGLTNGTAYTFTVKAVNIVGDSPASSPSNSVTPATVPDAPTGVSAVAGNAQATISFTAPVNTGGSPITGYKINSSPVTTERTSSVSPYTFTGLTNGTAYTFTVKAVNAVGDSVASSASNSVTPSASPTWKALPSGGAGLSLSTDRIFATAKYGNIVYVGGRFTSINGVAANNIAQWNTSTSSWSPVGNGIGGDTPFVNALTVDASGNLYAGGTFTTAGVATVNNVAKWDGESWVALQDGLNNTVNALTVDTSGNVYAGGSFTGTFGDTILFNYVAKWNVSTSSWVSLDNVMNNNILALAIDSSGILYAGGNFTTDGGSPGNYVAKCNTSTNSWSSLGGSLNNRVYSLAVDSSGNLYVGGSFTYNFDETIVLNYTAKWNGSGWEPLGSGMNTEVFGITVDGSDNLYATGNFTIAGDILVNFVAKWNPGTASWSALGDGLTTAGLTLVIGGTDLYVGARKVMNAQGGPTLNGIGSYGPL